MGLRNFEAKILRVLREVAQDNTIRQKDIMEWSTSEVKAQEGETVYHLPELGVWCAVKKQG